MAKQISIDGYKIKQVVITEDKAVVVYTALSGVDELYTKTIQIDIPKNTADSITEKVLDKIKLHEGDV